VPRQQRNLWAAESSLREFGTASLEDALSYLDLLAEQKPEKLERAALRWHGRLETEATFLSLAESQLALAALASLCAGVCDAINVLRRLLTRVYGRRWWRVLSSAGAAERAPRRSPAPPPMFGSSR
jgi:hypothetical protein